MALFMKKAPSSRPDVADAPSHQIDVAGAEVESEARHAAVVENETVARGAQPASPAKV